MGDGCGWPLLERNKPVSLYQVPGALSSGWGGHGWMGQGWLCRAPTTCFWGLRGTLGTLGPKGDTRLPPFPSAAGRALPHHQRNLYLVTALPFLPPNRGQDPRVPQWQWSFSEPVFPGGNLPSPLYIYRLVALYIYIYMYVYVSPGLSTARGGSWGHTLIAELYVSSSDGLERGQGGAQPRGTRHHSRVRLSVTPQCVCVPAARSGGGGVGQCREEGPALGVVVEDRGAQGLLLPQFPLLSVR